MRFARAFLVVGSMALVFGTAASDDVINKKSKGGSSQSGGPTKSSGGGSKQESSQGSGSKSGPIRSSGGSQAGPSRTSGGSGPARSNGGPQRTPTRNSPGGAPPRISSGGPRTSDTIIGGGRGSSDRPPVILSPQGGTRDSIGIPRTPRSTSPRVNPGGDQLLRRKVSRSGSVNYGSINNASVRGRIDSPVVIGRAPVDIRSGSLQNQVLREDRPRLVRDGYRVGYYHYNPRWCDDYFYYPFYVFDCYQPIRCVVSPWYYYPMLPGYLNFSRVVVLNYIVSPFIGSPYQWRPIGNYWDRNYANDLDLVVDDIIRAFEEQDRRAIAQLIPRRGNVAIYMDGRYSYSLDNSDFYDLMLDNIENTRTLRYTILDVRSSRTEAQVVARHEYEDPWGRNVAIFHRYRLADERGQIVIREFEVSDRW